MANGANGGSLYFSEFSCDLTGMPVTHVWQGHGSAIFIEFGGLKPTRKFDGSPGNPFGEFGLMIEWSWRIEGKRKIWCGSWSEERRWPRVVARLTGATVTSATLYGRLPEIDLCLSNGLHLLSMMTAEGDPSWALIDHRTEPPSSMGVRAGRLHMTGGNRS